MAADFLKEGRLPLPKAFADNKYNYFKINIDPEIAMPQLTSYAVQTQFGDGEPFVGTANVSTLNPEGAVERVLKTREESGQRMPKRVIVLQKRPYDGAPIRSFLFDVKEPLGFQITPI